MNVVSKIITIFGINMRMSVNRIVFTFKSPIGTP
jgi:hypothetical protein